MENFEKGIDELLKRKENIVDDLWIELKARNHTNIEIKEELFLLDEKN